MRQGVLARRQRDPISGACVAIIALGWFGMNTLVTSLGPMSQSVRFYDMLSILRHPVLLFLGVGSGHALEIVSFSLLCLAVLGAAFAPLWSTHRAAALAGWLPLSLMLAVFGLLYGSGAAWQPAASSPAHLFNDSLIRFTNGAISYLSNRAASHVSLGWGGAASLLAGALLALRATQAYRAIRLQSQRLATHRAAQAQD